VNNDPENPEGLVPSDYATYQLFERDDLVFKLIDLENLRTSRVGHVHEDGIMSSAYVRLRRCVPGVTRYYFWQYYDLYARHVFNSLGGGVRSTLGARDLIELPMLSPPLTEQRAIADYLDSETARIDALIDRKQRFIDLLLEKRTALITHAVTKGLDPNAETKDSGIEFIGEVPRHWSVAPLYARYDVTLGKMLDAKRVTGEHLGPYLRNADVQWDVVNVDGLDEMDFSLSDRVKFRLLPGDLLVCEGGEVGRTAMWRGELEECFYQKAVHRLRPHRPDLDVPRFFYYLMRASAKSERFAVGSNVATIGHLTATQLRHHRFGFPPIGEQRSIVEFLDRETGKIDGLYDKTERSIELLREYRTALISAAVTGQIDIPGIDETEDVA
jgi:type I restriction enzyme S subunit